MSYLALARKWRPKRFNEVVGQAHVLTALENALDQNRLHHAYLFSGTRGVGKTSIGRLFAKGLNCETGITSAPCGKCQSCIEIDQGRFVDLLEIDAASRTKVEDTRELLDNVQYKPARGRFKVYLIDEVHMLSKHSFNALLKTLEEPPEYVKFLLATTDPQKLPVTILSRCLQFHLKPISVDDIHQQLSHVLTQEQLSFEERALGLISHAADGSMRDALSLTDQAIALGNGNVESDGVARMLGTLDGEQALHLLEAIAHKQAQSTLTALTQLASNGVSWDGLLQELAMQLHRIAMYQALPATLDDAHDIARVQLLASTLSPQEVQLYYQIALKGRKELSLSPTERAGVEMTLLRMLAFAPAPQATANVIRVDAPQVTNAIAASIPVVDTHAMPERQSPVEQAKKAVATKPVTTPSAPKVAPELSHPATEPTPTAPQAPSEPISAPEPVQPSRLGGIRHQLRSRRQQGTAANQSEQEGVSIKKAPTAQTKKQSVLERVTQKHPPTEYSESVLSSAPETTTAKEYQWQPSQVKVEQVTTPSITPAMLRQALMHEKTPEMIEKLQSEAIQADAWSALINQTNSAKLVQQLALNSHLVESEQALTLHLRAGQKHLDSERSRQDLANAIAEVKGNFKPVEVLISDEGTTPLELRDTFYQSKLTQAFESLQNDEHIKFMQTRFAAELDNDSVRPI
ncbi:DNA polymerase III subunit gamma/tau [Vibrio gallicus]|uniref:DNA polymerase III subunit gamma/tau n=1 Tax=Vibrio gallicus TaxID=190897 RepID=UPI0021C49817|nr:DNA polymerase III subunit gamma/tau [Vibrio gallicus]